MNDQLDPLDSRIVAQRDDPARKMQERRQEKERRKNTRNPIPPTMEERRTGERRASPPVRRAKSGSGLLGKFNIVLVLCVAGAGGYLYYQQDQVVKSLTATNQLTSLKIEELEAQLKASDTLLEQTEDETASKVNSTNAEIRRLRESASQNKKDVSSVQSSLKEVNSQLKSLSSKDAALVKKDSGLQWLANQAKNQAESAQAKLDEIEGKVDKLNVLSSKVGQIDSLSKEVAKIERLSKQVSIIDELEVAIDSIKPTDTSAIESTQAKIINAQNQLLGAQSSLTKDQSDIKLALELIADRITNLELAIDVIDDHRMRIQQDLANLKQTP